jgi:hypothetical protein
MTTEAAPAGTTTEIKASPTGPTAYGVKTPLTPTAISACVAKDARSPSAYTVSIDATLEVSVRCISANAGRVVSEFQRVPGSITNCAVVVPTV